VRTAVRAGIIKHRPLLMGALQRASAQSALVSKSHGPFVYVGDRANVPTVILVLPVATDSSLLVP
jgi:hypothetical protein